ncbi:MAG: hypothetical protein LBI57_05540 [Helicobacteraceae bacterium]|nr:hypothetical protein [Helicobacteraceae bacterium]
MAKEANADARYKLFKDNNHIATVDGNENYLVIDQPLFEGIIRECKISLLQKYIPYHDSKDKRPVIFHTTHIDHLQGVIEHGLFAHNNPYRIHDISNQKVNDRGRSIRFTGEDTIFTILFVFILTQETLSCILIKTIMAITSLS